MENHIVESQLSAPAATSTVPCPYCRSTDSDLFSLFGQQLLTVQYYCNTCHTPFEYIKDDDILSGPGARSHVFLKG